MGSQLITCAFALPEAGLGLGVVAHLLATLARHPHEAVSCEFDAIRVAAEIALGRFRQTPRQRRELICLPPFQHFIRSDGAFAIAEENRIGESREESRQG